ncbi:hypothetical protein PPTG_20792 [Phytophthora nicotianae INRA-310]|uniref:Uncharacterized protein n=1 Tax=Phytophthora nicotianae (strain INRA-310) TaxID=761204 RepID=W2RGC1_PHYN3|nr:hypothetical protein PPTG_20792 [Phytophthora nicotianae INRA-310]ETN24483.1 hypothetical protein PPTG_20792 [Phytophthora nicotianae INRA-310]
MTWALEASLLKISNGASIGAATSKQNWTPTKHIAWLSQAHDVQMSTMESVEPSVL